MFDFSGLPTETIYDEENDANIKLDMNLLLEKIDMADYSYYETLSEKEKKHFQPYIVLRWISSLDDSIQITYNSKKIEAIFGKWSSGGKDSLNELKDEFNLSGLGTCVSVAKYEHAKYDWRIKFAMKDNSSVNSFIDYISEFGISGHEIISLIDSETIKYHLTLLNNMVNVNFWEMKNHPELVYQMMCSVSSIIGAEKRAHNWLPHCKGLKNVDKTIFDIIKSTQPDSIAVQMNESEYKILLFSYTVSTFNILLEDLGIPESDIKKIIKQFKSELEKYGKDN